MDWERTSPAPSEPTLPEAIEPLALPARKRQPDTTPENRRQAHPTTPESSRLGDHLPTTEAIPAQAIAEINPLNQC
jgi:hypothetical protein